MGEWLMSACWDGRWRARVKAAGLHFAFSLVVIMIAAVTLFLVWFPTPYWSLAGGRRLIEIILAVDLVLGPLLTLLLFDIRKSRLALALDMSMVLVLQIGALSYGLHSAYVARPVYLVYEVDRFVVVTAADVDSKDLSQAAPEFRHLPFRGIQRIGVRDPQTPDERMKAFELALAGKDLSLRPEYWNLFEESGQQQLRQRMRPLADLAARGVREAQVVGEFVEGTGRSAESFTYIPIISRELVWSVVLDLKSLDIVGYVPIDGF